MKLKKRLLPLLAIFLGLVLLVNNFRPRPIPPITPQQRTSHMLEFYAAPQGFMGVIFGSKPRPVGLCTGTAIGPHAILTALHCDEDGGARIVRLDISTHDYHIITGITDDRDHLILLIDGPPLKNYVPIEKLVNVRPVGLDEHVFIYGDGEGHYPPVRRDGQVDKVAQAADVSEVDQAQGTNYYTLDAIPGDSGSAIYGEDGRVVGIVTYKWNEPNSTAKCAGFALNFSEQKIRFAEEFDPANVVMTPLGPIYAPSGKPPQK